MPAGRRGGKKEKQDETCSLMASQSLFHYILQFIFNTPREGKMFIDDPIFTKVLQRKKKEIYQMQSGDSKLNQKLPSCDLIKDAEKAGFSGIMFGRQRAMKLIMF